MLHIVWAELAFWLIISFCVEPKVRIVFIAF
jgi:hypothetical protein